MKKIIFKGCGTAIATPFDESGVNFKVFGDSHLDEFSKKLDFKVLGKLPIVSENATRVDSGKVEDIQLPEFESITESILEGGQA